MSKLGNDLRLEKQKSILDYLENGKVSALQTAAQIAKGIGSTSQSVRKLLEQLNKLKLVNRWDSPCFHCGTRRITWSRRYETKR